MLEQSVLGAPVGPTFVGEDVFGPFALFLFMNSTHCSLLKQSQIPSQATKTKLSSGWRSLRVISGTQVIAY